MYCCAASRIFERNSPGSDSESYWLAKILGTPGSPRTTNSQEGASLRTS